MDGRRHQDHAAMSACPSARRLVSLALALALGAVAAEAAAPSINPTGVPNGVEDVYRTAVRSRLATQRALLRPFYLTTGQVVLGLEIDRQGRLVNGAILTGSGSTALDRAAARMATLAAPFAPPPQELAGDPIAVKVVLTLPDDKAGWDSLLEAAAPPAAR
jgi:TonB family protein